MQSKILVGTAALALTFCLALPAHATDAPAVRSNDLIEDAARWDGQTVVFEGEAIGEVLPRGEYAWINLADEGNTLGCWVTAAMAKEITCCGRYGQHGDTLRVVATFQRACPDHGGDLDLHAISLTKTAAGYPVAHPVESRMAWGAGLGLAGAAAAGLAYLRRKRVTE